MRGVVLSFVLLILSGCASSQKPGDQYSYVRVNSGVKVTPAVVINPVPVCDKPVEVARLDKAPELQVYVDVDGGGDVCKSARF